MTSTTSTEQRRAAARVRLRELTGLPDRIIQWCSRRTYGDVLDNWLALMRNKPCSGRCCASSGASRSGSAWTRPDLKLLAHLAAASRIDCSWCMDLGWYAGHSQGLDASKPREVPRWRESKTFTELERPLLE